MGEGEDDYLASDQFICEMPFVVCESNGGPLDDQSFVVGFELGQINSELFHLSCSVTGHRAVPDSRYVHPEGVMQLDLLAMKYGYTLHVEEELEDWTLVSFSIPRDDTSTED